MKKIILVLATLFYVTFFAFGKDQNTNLYNAILKNDTLLVKQLLNNNADPNFIISQGQWMKVNMLITAVNKKNFNIVKMLIEHKANINWKDGFKTTALMYAASNGSKEIFTLLLNNGANINDKDEQGNTVLSAAKEGNNNEIIRIVEEKLKQ